MRELTARPVLATTCLLGEGPFWDAASGMLVFVDIKGRRISRWAPGADVTHFDMPGDVGFAIPAETGGFIAGIGNDLCHVAETGEILDVLENLPGTTHRINDGTIATDGTVWFGTMDDDECQPLGHYWSYAAGRLRRHDIGWIITNGPALTPDGDMAYLAASCEGRVFRTRLRGGDFGAIEPFATFPKEWGHPDGMVVDRRGNVWISHWGGGRVTCFSPDGAPSLEVRVPAPRPTKCAFGLADRATLLITSASIGLDPDAHPLAGQVFACSVNIDGPALPRARL